MITSNIAAIVLAGGRGKRMAGRDKGLVDLCGVPLVKWVVDAITPQVDQIVISANRNLEQYEALGYTVVADELADYQGPLAGIQAALRKISLPFVLVVPADTPELPANLCEKLKNSLIKADADIAVVEVAGRIQPVTMMFRLEMKNDIGNWLDSGSRKVLGWIESRSYVPVCFSEDELPDLNINDANGLAEASARLCR